MNDEDAKEWYPMEPMACGYPGGQSDLVRFLSSKPTKKRRIALLEKQVADLQSRLAALEARPVPPVVYPTSDPWSPPLGPTYGPTRLGSTANPVDLTPNVTC